MAVASRVCSNDCGKGTQTCSDGAWSECNVPPAIRSCSSECGQGQQTCIDGGWQSCDAPQPGPPTFTATIRDFRDTHPDFESEGGVGLDPGVVASELGADDKPVYAGAPSTKSTHGAMFFDEWYRDPPLVSPGVNLSTSVPIPLSISPTDATLYRYDDDAFFPIDGRLFGNQGRPHNFDFTLELVTQFRYTGGEIFSFTSDDDSWIFLNRRLAVDLGGIHWALSASVNLDLDSQKLGITKGAIYPMHLFYAERHVVNAVLHIDVAAADFAFCPGAMP